MKKKALVVGLMKMGNLQRAAQRAAEIVHDDPGFGEREGVVGVQRRVFMVLKNAAVEVVGAGFGDGGDVGDAAEFGVVVGLADANFLDGVEGGKHFVDGAGVFDADAEEMPSMVTLSRAAVVPHTARLPLSSVCTPASVVSVEMGLVEPVERE